MKNLFILCVLFSGTGFAQTFPFGTYYQLPKSKNASSDFIELRALEISKDSVVEKYVTKELGVLPGGEFKSAIKIDTLFRNGLRYHFLYIQNDRYFFMSFTVNKANKLLYFRDSYMKTDLFSRAAAVKYILEDTIPAFTMPVYTRQEVQHFSKLPPVNNIDSATLVKVLQNIRSQEKSEAALLLSMDAQTRSLYRRSRFHSIGYLRHFLEAGISPLISSRDMNALETRFKDNRTIKELLKEVEYGAL